ncbi:hypothetical protein CLOM_g9225 [Closterium sp. NIES-68]|nr:hypothetical protein CLOM_g9225 [Closterium sp. NIES-68]GJP61409.1 hypothetical protein CLOP_g18577 [Closterium sp. NIES-67]
MGINGTSCALISSIGMIARRRHHGRRTLWRVGDSNGLEQRRRATNATFPLISTVSVVRIENQRREHEEHAATSDSAGEGWRKEKGGSRELHVAA